MSSIRPNFSLVSLTKILNLKFRLWYLKIQTFSEMTSTEVKNLRYTIVTNKSTFDFFFLSGRNKAST